MKVIDCEQILSKLNIDITRYKDINLNIENDYIFLDDVKKDLYFNCSYECVHFNISKMFEIRNPEITFVNSKIDMFILGGKDDYVGIDLLKINFIDCEIDELDFNTKIKGKISLNILYSYINKITIGDKNSILDVNNIFIDYCVIKKSNICSNNIIIKNSLFHDIEIKTNNNCLIEYSSIDEMSILLLDKGYFTYEKCSIETFYAFFSLDSVKSLNNKLSNVGYSNIDSQISFNKLFNYDSEFIINYFNKIFTNGNSIIYSNINIIRKFYRYIEFKKNVKFIGNDSDYNNDHNIDNLFVNRPNVYQQNMSKYTSSYLDSDLHKIKDPHYLSCLHKNIIII